MPELDVEAYKREVFGNGQSPTHTPTPPPTTETQNTATQTVLDKVVEPTTTQPITQPATPAAAIPPTEEDLIVNADDYLQEQLGIKTWDEAKAALAELSELKAAATSRQEVKYANEQSKLLYDAILAGESDKVYEILDTQKKLAAVETMKPADAIKLHIQQTHREYKPIDVEDVFEEKYSYPEKPVQDATELDSDFKSREDKWSIAKEKIDRRIERDSASAKIELSKLSAELKLPEITKPTNNQQPNIEGQKELQKEAEAAEKFYSKLSPKDIQMVFKFNDEATKLAFDIVYEPEKESFEKAKALATNPATFFADYYEKDGSPKRTEFIRDLYAGRNVQKIVSEAIVQAVNQERIRALKYQKNIGDGTQRNYVLPPVSEIEKLKQQVFS